MASSPTFEEPNNERDPHLRAGDLFPKERDKLSLS